MPSHAILSSISVSAPPVVESRAASAVDIALWDLFGKAVGKPLVQLLGGWTRDRVRTYNTCAGDRYMRKAETQSSRNWGISEGEESRCRDRLRRSERLPDPG